MICHSQSKVGHTLQTFSTRGHCCHLSRAQTCILTHNEPLKKSTLVPVLLASRVKYKTLIFCCSFRFSGSRNNASKAKRISISSAKSSMNIIMTKSNSFCLSLSLWWNKKKEQARGKEQNRSIYHFLPSLLPWFLILTWPRLDKGRIYFLMIFTNELLTFQIWAEFYQVLWDSLLLIGSRNSTQDSNCKIRFFSPNRMKKQGWWCFENIFPHASIWENTWNFTRVGLKKIFIELNRCWNARAQFYTRVQEGNISLHSRRSRLFSDWIETLRGAEAETRPKLISPKAINLVHQQQQQTYKRLNCQNF